MAKTRKKRPTVINTRNQKTMELKPCFVKLLRLEAKTISRSDNGQSILTKPKLHNMLKDTENDFFLNECSVSKNKILLKPCYVNLSSSIVGALNVEESSISVGARDNIGSKLNKSNMDQEKGMTEEVSVNSEVKTRSGRNRVKIKENIAEIAGHCSSESYQIESLSVNVQDTNDKKCSITSKEDDVNIMLLNTKTPIETVIVKRKRRSTIKRKYNKQIDNNKVGNLNSVKGGEEAISKINQPNIIEPSMENADNNVKSLCPKLPTSKAEPVIIKRRGRQAKKKLNSKIIKEETIKKVNQLDVNHLNEKNTQQTGNTVNEQTDFAIKTLEDKVVIQNETAVVDVALQNVEQKLIQNVENGLSSVEPELAKRVRKLTTKYSLFKTEIVKKKNRVNGSAVPVISKAKVNNVQNVVKNAQLGAEEKTLTIQQPKITIKKKGIDSVKVPVNKIGKIDKIDKIEKQTKQLNLQNTHSTTDQFTKALPKRQLLNEQNVNSERRLVGANLIFGAHSIDSDHIQPNLFQEKIIPNAMRTVEKINFKVKGTEQNKQLVKKKLSTKRAMVKNSLSRKLISNIFSEANSTVNDHPTKTGESTGGSSEFGGSSEPAEYSEVARTSESAGFSESAECAEITKETFFRGLQEPGKPRKETFFRGPQKNKMSDIIETKTRLGEDIQIESQYKEETQKKQKTTHSVMEKKAPRKKTTNTSTNKIIKKLVNQITENATPKNISELAGPTKNMKIIVENNNNMMLDSIIGHESGEVGEIFDFTSSQKSLTETKSWKKDDVLLNLYKQGKVQIATYKKGRGRPQTRYKTIKPKTKIPKQVEHQPSTPINNNVSSFSNLARSAMRITSIKNNEVFGRLPTRARVTDKKQLLDAAQKFVNNASSSISNTNNNFVGNNTSPVSSLNTSIPWRIENAQQLFNYSQNHLNFPSVSSDILHSDTPKKSIPRNYSPSNSSFSLNLNESNVENFYPDKETKVIETNPRKGIQYRSPLKNINILEVRNLSNLVLGDYYKISTPIKESNISGTQVSSSFIGTSFNDNINLPSKHSSASTDAKAITCMEDSINNLFGFSEDITEPDAIREVKSPQKKLLTNKLKNLKRLLPERKIHKPIRISMSTVKAIYKRDSPIKQKTVTEMFCSTMISGNSPKKSVKQAFFEGALQDEENVQLSENTAPEASIHTLISTPSSLNLFNDVNDESTFNSSSTMKTYARSKPKRKKMRHHFITFLESESEEEDEEESSPKRKTRKYHKKDCRPKETNADLENFITDFNSMCDEIADYELVVEPEKP